MTREEMIDYAVRRTLVHHFDNYNTVVSAPHRVTFHEYAVRAEQCFPGNVEWERGGLRDEVNKHFRELEASWR